VENHYNVETTSDPQVMSCDTYPPTQSKSDSQRTPRRMLDCGDPRIEGRWDPVMSTSLPYFSSSYQGMAIGTSVPPRRNMNQAPSHDAAKNIKQKDAQGDTRIQSFIGLLH
jgi:hypothetical protein